MAEAEVRSRLLRAGVEEVDRTGLTVSLAHLSFETLIHDAGVARSAGYRAWSSKEAYFDDLLVELAGAAWAGTAAFGPEVVQLGVVVLAQHVDSLDTPEGRRAAWIDTSRVTAQANFEQMQSRKEWRTYVAVVATVLSLPSDGALRLRIEDTLQESERRFAASIAEQYAGLGRLVGQRVRPEVGHDFTLIGLLAASILEGLGLRRTISPVVTESFRCDTYGEGTRWTPAGLMLAASIDALIEPDPDFDESSVPHVQAELRAAAAQIEAARTEVAENGAADGGAAVDVPPDSDT